MSRLGYHFKTGREKRRNQLAFTGEDDKYLMVTFIRVSVIQFGKTLALVSGILSSTLCFIN